MRVATDVGGTFTDLVGIEGGNIIISKADTTPPNFDQGVMNAVEKATLNPNVFEDFVHGTTVVINALLSRRGVKTALITTRGFKDVLEIARGNRPDLFNFAFEKPAPFVPRYLRHEITERMDYLGNVVQDVKLSELGLILTDLKAEGVEAIAISFLHAYINPNHEISVAKKIAHLWPEVSVMPSHTICGEWREYERTSTAVLSAYVHPIAKKYLSSLENQLSDRGLRKKPLIMRSNGGVATVDSAQNDPISLVESGPASGVLGAAALGMQIGEPNLIALDIGGTTAKTALIENGEVRITTEYKIEWSRSNPGYPIKTPVVELVEIGNGGGSIAWVDKGGRMHVGPQSAGSQPGPAAYGRGGTEPTTTDANLLLGRINPDLFLGGEQYPNFENVERAFQKISRKIGGTPIDIARGVIRIANANMVNALKLVSLNRGYDPRDFSLIAFGGGGAMHAVALAEELMVKKLIIPVNSSVFSAWGMLMCDLRRDFIRTRVTKLVPENISVISKIFTEIENESHNKAIDEGMPKDKIRIERYLDARYEGQEHTVKIPLTITDNIDDGTIQNAIEVFHATHEREFTFCQEASVEIVNFHVVILSDIDKQPLPTKRKSGLKVEQVLKGVREVDFDEKGIHVAQVYDWIKLEPDMQVAGPAIIEDPTSTLVISPGKKATTDNFGNIHINMEIET